MPLCEGRRILIVDDEQVITETLVQIFRSHGYEARSATSAEQALELLDGWSPDMAILDVSLAAMNGVELAIVLTTRYPKCRILLFSGRSESGDIVHQAAERGSEFEIFAKPVHPSFLLDWAAQEEPNAA